MLSPRLTIPVVLLLLLLVCGTTASEASRLRVVTTATMITDMVENIGGDRVIVEGLMGPGVDPHLYRPAASDINRINRADAVFYMGLFFEERMVQVFERLERRGRPIFAVTDSISRDKLLPADDTDMQYDPHVWLDAGLWADCVETVVEGLIRIDPDGETYYRERGDAYRDALMELHQWAMDTAARLPESKRILVTSHDAFNYFGRAYGFQVVGLMGISTVTEAGLADIANLVDFIRDRNVPAVFVESSVSPRALERVSRDSGAQVGGSLFSDAMGARGEIRKGHDVGTYDGMFRYNMLTIVNALER